MYAKGKSNNVPSDSQAREKLALYVYEYLLHVGAQKSAQTFLSEIRWEKNITLGEPPGFLHSWWCVFWDLYCAAPERRETCEHSSEAKAFHDYVSYSHSAWMDEWCGVVVKAQSWDRWVDGMLESLNVRKIDTWIDDKMLERWME
ncbi:single-stranded DNA-binding protein 2-like [Sinocyclocheilus grahami]|uniref:single-stranded DNA-binding protein 2-like n=1 Tax=Sinocyclocheilus grahami TaxID=75366 RepID=UPI0007AC8A0A|nr:PREDICTED: single-stranded DNA-binding protein 2-like [Sinocyclocheilus grahami]